MGTYFSTSRSQDSFLHHTFTSYLRRSDSRSRGKSNRRRSTTSRVNDWSVSFYHEPSTLSVTSVFSPEYVYAYVSTPVHLRTLTPLHVQSQENGVEIRLWRTVWRLVRIPWPRKNTVHNVTSTSTEGNGTTSVSPGILPCTSRPFTTPSIWGSILSRVPPMSLK